MTMRRIPALEGTQCTTAVYLPMAEKAPTTLAVVGMPFLFRRLASIFLPLAVGAGSGVDALRVLLFFLVAYWVSMCLAARKGIDQEGGAMEGGGWHTCCSDLPCVGRCIFIFFEKSSASGCTTCKSLCVLFAVRQCA